ncbi:hypothetical protein P7K49_027660, partial [Saguinus oedipus]
MATGFRNPRKDCGLDPRADACLTATLALPSSPHTQFLASMQTHETPVETLSPAIRLIDRGVKPPYVQCCELMGFRSPGQIPRLLLVPEHLACGVYEKQ